MTGDIVPFGWKRNLVFIKESFRILVVETLEYKVHALGMAGYMVFDYFTTFLIAFILAKEFGDIIGWTLNDFILLLIINSFMWGFIGLFQWGRIVSDTVIKGELNIKLCRPLPNWIKFYFNPFHSSGLTLIITSTIFSFIMFTIYEFEIQNKLLIVFFTLWLSLLLFLLFATIDTLEFYYYKLSLRIRNTVELAQDILGAYPGQFFGNFRFRGVFSCFTFILYKYVCSSNI